LFSPPVDIQLGNLGYFIPNGYDDIYLNPISPLGSPKKQTIGDIQFTSMSQSVCGPTTNSLNIYFDPAVGISGGSTAETFLLSGIYTSGGKAPSTYNSYSYQVNYINGVSTQQLAFIPGLYPPIQLNFISNNVTVVNQVSYVCPAISFVNITGCYDCMVGYQATFLISSSCSSGSCYVSTSDCPPQSFIFNSTEQTITLGCQSNSSTISNTASVQCQSSSTSVSYSGMLSAPSSNSNQFGNTTSSPVSSSLGFDAGFLSSTVLGLNTGLSSLWSFILNLLLLGIILILAILMVTTLIPIMINFIKSKDLKSLFNFKSKPKST